MQEYPLSKILTLIDRNKLILPDFQRELEWKVDKQKYLLASFIACLPIGSLLLLEGKKDDFAVKKMCFPKDPVTPKDECFFLLDGQQRISSLKSIFSDFFVGNWRDAWERIYPDLRYRWFIRIKPKNGEEDLFGWNKLELFDLKIYEPQQIFEVLEYKKIFKTIDNVWYNPGYAPKDNNGKVLPLSRKLLKIAKDASSEGLIPLYSLYNPGGSKQISLHARTIEQIALDRMQELKADTENNINEKITLLSNIEPDIEQKIHSNENIDNVWHRLSSNWTTNVKDYLEKLLEQNIPLIEVPSNEIHRAISIFESINLGGTPLSTFDLIIAKAARNQSLGSLLKRIITILERETTLSTALTERIIGKKPYKWVPANVKTIENNKISKTVKDQYLNLLTIFSNTEYGDVESIKIDYMKKKEHLNLDHECINSNTEITIISIIRACAFLHFRCGIVSLKELPYELMILPIAYALRDDAKWNDESMLAKIEYWYWSSIFSGAYREGHNEQCKNDIKNLYSWLVGQENKFNKYYDSIFKNINYSDKDTLLKRNIDRDIKVPKSIEKGIFQFVLSGQPIDFLPDKQTKLRLNTWDIATKKIFDYKGNPEDLFIQDHHICPVSSAAKIEESSKEIRKDSQHILNSPLNRTYISKTANIALRNFQPSEYFSYLNEASQWNHCIPTPIDEVYRKKADETDNQYYNRVLEKRFYEIEKSVKQRLENLESKFCI